jgi:NADP-dependent 3-hydroxy acid dehydrogenase YdfG
MADSPVLKPGVVALVVGAGSGIGEAIAVSLAGRGCRVICAGRRVERLDGLAGRLGAGAYPLRLDVTDPESTASVVERLPEDLRQIDILVNSAGHDIGGRRRFDLGQAQEWADIVDTNVNGVIRVCHAVIPQMLARGVGHVVNIGSNSGLQGYAGGTAYVASKFAARGFSDALRLDYQDTDLRITEIQPGMTRTEFARMRFHGDKDRGDRYYDDAAQCLAADDVARAVVYALEQPAHVTIARLLLLPTREQTS